MTSGEEVMQHAGVGVAPHAPGPGDPVERDLAIGALKAVAVIAPPVMLVAWLLAGTGGLLGASIATAVVAGMYLLSGLLLSYAARFGPGALMGAALGGFALRLMIYTLMMVLLRPVEAIHGPSLAISAAVLLVLTLVWEARIVSRTPSLFWIDARAARPNPAAPIISPTTLSPTIISPTTISPTTRNPA